LDNNEILLIHLGGLGDVCLSESLFLSFQKQFDDCLVGLGNKRFLDLFQEYFKRVEGVESRKWLYLFSEKLDGPRWRQIIFIGKDREGILRNRWQANSEEKIIFIDMYPEYAFERVCGSTLSKQRMQCEALSSQGEREGVASMALPLEGATRAPVVEDYQLGQLTPYSVEPLKKKIPWNKSQRVILYPEKGYEKEKWHHDNFVNIYHSLKAHDVDVILLESLGLSVNVDNKVFLEDLTEIKQFFSEGGIFVSNDSGMAHLAGTSGLFTITIFTGFDPVIWHPRGRNISLIQEGDAASLSLLEKHIIQAMQDSS
jgi:ADP-heptose:LPS heptosyltransferase